MNCDYASIRSNCCASSSNHVEKSRRSAHDEDWAAVAVAIESCAAAAADVRTCQWDMTTLAVWQSTMARDGVNWASKWTVSEASRASTWNLFRNHSFRGIFEDNWRKTSTWNSTQRNNFQIIGFSLVWRNHVYAIMFQVALSLEISRQKYKRKMCMIHSAVLERNAEN